MIHRLFVDGPLRFRCLCAALVLLQGLLASTAVAGEPRPNVLFILADDLGINDLAAFRIRHEGEHAPANVGASLTPTIDSLARQGARFNRFYSNATCAATRAGVLAGHAPEYLGFRPAGSGIDPAINTLPEMLREAGYRTSLVGKWHLGFGDRQAWPLQQGFDQFYGFLNQFFLQRPAAELRPGRPGYRNPWLQRDNGPREQQQGHLSWLLAEEARRQVLAMGDSDQPWFLAFWPYAPHEPLQPPKDIAEGFEDSPVGRHSALLATLDQQVAVLLQSLAQTGQRERTLIVFASDNGGTARYASSNKPLLGGKGQFYEGGLRVPLVLQGPGIAPGTERDDLASYLDLMPTILARAGLDPPRYLAGRNLLGSAQVSEPLFWSSGVGEAQDWSALSRDGIWRLVVDRLHPSGLLQRVEAQAPALPVGDAQIQEQLTHAYEQWAAKARRVSIVPKPATEGLLQVNGSRFQRAPGAGAHTLGLCLTLSLPPRGDDLAVLAEQRGLWSLAQTSDGFLWSINGLELRAPYPAQANAGAKLGRLLLVSDFNPSLAFPGQRAEMHLYWNDELLGSHESDEFPLERNLDYPLVIGGESFTGKLGSVAIWNDTPPRKILKPDQTQQWHQWSGGFRCADTVR